MRTTRPARTASFLSTTAKVRSAVVTGGAQTSQHSNQEQEEFFWMGLQEARCQDKEGDAKRNKEKPAYTDEPDHG
jgi:hypothetical protein